MLGMYVVYKRIQRLLNAFHENMNICVVGNKAGVSWVFGE